ncbi:MAG: hypothetical protein KTR31_39945 [Myxococcales bacterium]|nr:hypothetical protein [Myxococcales bacterium]
MTAALWAIAAAVAAEVADVRAFTREFPAMLDPPELVEGYSFMSTHFDRLVDLAEERPAAVRIETLGTTTRGRPIYAFHVAEPHEPVVERVLVFAGIHPTEWISVEVAVQILEELIRRPVPGISVTVIPVLNVDGRVKSESDVAIGRFKAFRRGNGASPPVDLNRDFAVHRESRSIWRRLLPGYHATSPTGALSQPETQALDALARRQLYDRAVSLHAFGGYHYYPWSGRWRRAEDHRRFVALGRSMEAAQGAGAYRPRQLSRWGFFFRAQGTEIDHLYGEYGTEAFLMELTRSGIRPWRLRKDLRTPFRWYNPRRPRKHVERGVSAVRALIRGIED